jgi:hypothetical protein
LLEITVDTEEALCEVSTTLRGVPLTDQLIEVMPNGESEKDHS